jgi:FdhD protein
MGGTILACNQMSDVIDQSGDFSVPIWCAVNAIRLAEGAEPLPQSSDVAEEVPVAFRYNGFAHAVMMATPDHLTDFVAGFSLTEGIIAELSTIEAIRVGKSADGMTVDVTLDALGFHRYLAERRVRQSRGNTSCGLCGVEDLKDLRSAPIRVAAGAPVTVLQAQIASDALRLLQPLSRRTRGAHASAWVGSDGAIRAVREDVGRHNALDKLIGAGLRGAFSRDDGFCLITSRCSFEMAQKAIAAGYSTLVSVSAPTALAIRTAAAAGLTLLSMDRSGGQYLYASPNGVA